MELSYILEQLKYGELANTFIGDLDDATMSDEHKRRIYTYIDMALMELNTKFNLNQDELIIPLVAGTCKYYINDISFIKVIAAYNNSGDELGINKEETYDTIFNPIFNVIEFQDDPDLPEPTTHLSIIFLKSFDRVTSKTSGIPISPALLEALLAYVGYRATIKDGAEVSGVFYRNFELACKRARENAVVSIDETADMKLYNRGFV